ncbi:MAG: HAD family hydrolase [Gemmatimonadota bacterium]
MTYLDQFAVMLLDMNGTFMFGHDRFGPDEDYFATYQALGGNRLRREELISIWQPSLAALLTAYNAPDRFDDFPTLAEVFMEQGAAPLDIPLLEQTFAMHEIGAVPDAHAAFIRDASRTHRLGVVSNICAHPDLWIRQCSSADVFTLFEALVFSSESRSIKPSARMFQRAISRFEDFPVLFVGDSLERDIIPAKSLGLSTVWLAPPGSAHPAADRVVESLLDLDS